MRTKTFTDLGPHFATELIPNGVRSAPVLLTHSQQTGTATHASLESGLALKIGTSESSVAVLTHFIALVLASDRSEASITAGL